MEGRGVVCGVGGVLEVEMYIEKRGEGRDWPGVERGSW